MKAIILAGGKGSRLGLEGLPKPMYKICGKPLLEHNLLLLKKHDVHHVCIAVQYIPEIIKNYFRDGSKLGINIEYKEEETSLGTSGAVKNAKNFLDNKSFFVIYGDNFTNINLSEMLKLHNSSNSIATIALFDPNKSINSGIAGGYVSIDEKNRLVSFTEGGKNKSNGYKNYVNAGTYILEKEVLEKIPDGISDFGKNIFPKLLQEGYKLSGYLTDSFVIAIDTKEALSKAEEAVGRND